ncbi:hypothetical protein JCM12856_15870 [Spirochaeta dissipatitropha]
MPSSILSRDSWFRGQPDTHGLEIYAGSWDGTWLPLISLDHDNIERLMLIDVKDDPVYQAFEIQLFRVGEELKGVAILARHDGSRVYYYQPGFPMSIERIEAVSALLNQPEFVEQDFELGIETHESGLSASLDIVDIDGRRISFVVRETKDSSETSAILAPVSSETENPSSFPMVFLDEFSMVRKRNTLVEIVIDDVERTPVVFPLLLDGRRVLYSRYSSRVVVADLLPEINGKVSSVSLESGSDHVVISNARYDFSWNHEYPELVSAVYNTGESSIRFDFQPPLPEIRHIAEDQAVYGRFTVSVNDVDAVIGGEYYIEYKNNEYCFALQPVKAWQPPGMSRRPWVESFSYEFLATRLEDGLQGESNWFRTDRK